MNKQTIITWYSVFFHGFILKYDFTFVSPILVYQLRMSPVPAFRPELEIRCYTSQSVSSTSNIWKKFILAATYSPIPSPVQYHRPSKS